MEKKYLYDFMESCGVVKIGKYSCLHKYMKICEYKRSRSFFDL